VTLKSWSEWLDWLGYRLCAGLDRRREGKGIYLGLIRGSGCGAADGAAGVRYGVLDSVQMIPSPLRFVLPLDTALRDTRCPRMVSSGPDQLILVVCGLGDCESVSL
jgi:hypothetical protein